MKKNTSSRRDSSRCLGLHERLLVHRWRPFFRSSEWPQTIHFLSFFFFTWVKSSASYLLPTIFWAFPSGRRLGWCMTNVDRLLKQNFIPSPTNCRIQDTLVDSVLRPLFESSRRRRFRSIYSSFFFFLPPRKKKREKCFGKFSPKYLE